MAPFKPCLMASFTEFKTNKSLNRDGMNYGLGALRCRGGTLNIFSQHIH